MGAMIFYLVGVLPTLFLAIYITVIEEGKLTASKLIFSLLLSFFSWFGLIFALVYFTTELGGDIIVWERKQK